MTASEARKMAQLYATEHGVLWVGVLQTQESRAGWFLGIEAFHFEIDTGGAGRAWTTVNVAACAVIGFEYYPLDPRRFWLPLWIAYPLYDAVTIGWRMGSGEQYWVAWHDWYRGLPEPLQAAYRQRYPEPAGWEGQYGWRT